MTDEPLPADAPGADGPDPDPLADTQPFEIPRFAPAPDPRPDARWAWSAPGSAPGDLSGDPGFGSTAGAAGSGGWPPSGAVGSPYGSGAWTPAGSGGGSVPPVWSPAGAAGQRRGGVGFGVILVASLLSAILASGGTVLLLGRTGAFDRQVASVNDTVPQPTGGGRPVTTNESSAVIDVAARLSPAVVKITVDGQTTDPFGAGATPTEGVGSGVIFDANGWILTNRHVVSGSTKLTVELKDGRTFAGTVYGIDTLTDLAIVKVDQTGLPTAPMGNSDGLKIGQLVIAIGSPLGTYSFSVTSGIVSGKQRDLQVSNGTTGASRITNLIQTDAAINPGNSGGPLADASGNVIGINTAIATDSSGIGFAIPVNIARPIMNQALKGVALSRPWIGIRFNSINLQLQQDLKLPVSAGALVTSGTTSDNPVYAGGPADKAGVRDGDIIVALNGIRIDAEDPLDALLTQFSPGETIRLDILRDGAAMTLQLTLGTRPADL